MKRTALFCPINRKGQKSLLMMKLALIALFAGNGMISASPPSHKSTLPQQEIVITGQVTDASTGETLPGVNIIVEGTGIGEITDDEGNYSITIPGESAVLVFSYVSYTSESVTAGSQRVINIVLNPELQSMEEVVVIGYGTIKKSDLTGAVASIKQAEIEKAAPVNILSAVQGRAAGVYVSQNSGAPGMEPVIRIRGTGTVNAHAPIYVIDGMIMDNSDVRDEASTINFLNPADIESMEVLKDASATAIYGSRGANGVILITTHKGFNSAPKVSFNAQVGFGIPQKFAENLGSAEYMEYVREAYANAYNTTNPDTLDYVIKTTEQYDKGYDTDWEDEVLKDGPALSQNYHLSIKGGTETARYASSFGYYDEEGLLVANSRYKRFSFRINSDFDLGKIFRIGENLSLSQMNLLGPNTDFIGVVRRATMTSPLYPVFKSDTLDPGDDNYLDMDPDDPDYEYNKFAGAPGSNPVASTYYNIMTQTNTLSLIGNIFAEATVLKGLTLRTSLGINMSNRKVDDFEPEYFITASNYQNNMVMKQSYWTNGWLWENTITYHNTVGKHLITALAGYTTEYNKYDFMRGTKQFTPSNAEEMRTLDAAISTPELNGSYDLITMISMLGRLNYAFDNRYLITASIRRDGSSKFGPDHRWGVFPSVSLGWNISNESFFENLKNNTIPNLKVRAGWGQIGNSSMSDANTNTYVSQFKSDPSLRSLFNNQAHPGYFFNVIGIPDLTWETTEQINVGIDVGLFRNALTIDADYFIKTTKDMLVKTHIPRYAGYGWYGTPWINAGTVENRGFEFLVNYKGNAGKFTYDLSVNGSTYKNVVLSTNFDSTDIWYHDSPTVIRVGNPVGSLFGYVTDGIFQTQEDVDAHVNSTGDLIQPFASPGDFRFKDLNGDGEISDGFEWDGENGGDQTIIGNPHPKFIFGFTINLGYRGFDVMTHWQGVIGNDLINIFKYRPNHFQYRSDGNYNPDRDLYLNAWRNHSTNTYPRITSSDKNENFRVSDFMVEDASYLRMKNIQLGYTLPQQLSARLHLASCRIWVGGTDLLTFTKYSGNDPEISLYDPSYSGYDNGDTYPKNRRFMVGINVKF